MFGKITGITDDALLIDLSGKANAIFDLRELLLPADDENEPAASEFPLKLAPYDVQVLVFESQ